MRSALCLSAAAVAALAAPTAPATAPRPFRPKAHVATRILPKGYRLGQYVTPSWTPTYVMNRSTIAMPCNDSGLVYNQTFLASVGIQDYDWSNAKQAYINHNPMDCEEMLLTQADMAVQANPSSPSRAFVYRNLVKALPWYSSVRAAMAANPEWFLPFKPSGPYHVPQCDAAWDPPRCSNLYHDRDQTPGYPHGDGSCNSPCDCGEGIPCGEYLWDHRNESLRTWLVNEFVMGPTGMGHPSVSGFYFDDGWTNYSAATLPWEPPGGFCDHSEFGGATEEDFYCSADMGLGQADTTAIRDGWIQTMSEVYAAVLAKGGFYWGGFVPGSTPVANNATACAATLRRECSADSEQYLGAMQQPIARNSTTGQPTQFSQDLAYFLLVRGPYAWLGYGWLGCSSGSEPPGAGGAPYVFPPEVNLDYGEPRAQCAETAPSSMVFTREWSKASVSFDCNTWTGTVTMAEQ